MISTVAVVDDEPRIRSLYATWLEERYEVVTAEGGETALEEIEGSVDAVLLDRRMPDLTGDEVLARLRDRGYDGWVVMVTAVDPDLDVAEMTFDDYIVKPVDKETLLEAVQVLVARSEYDENVRQYFQVLAKLGALEAALSEDELEGSDEYAHLLDERRQLKEQVTDTSAWFEMKDAHSDLFLDLEPQHRPGE
jgi:DNA-binding response OmpR family regulator